MFDVKVVLDSLAPSGRRLTTITATYPRFIHAEIMTHRDRARNAASSRAIPWSKMMPTILMNPVIPIQFGKERGGMVTGEEIERRVEAERIWLEARDFAVDCAWRLARLEVHKSICNRLTEPFMWITVVMSATEWKNFFRLRCHPDAEVHFQKIAYMIRAALARSTPAVRGEGEWHLPFIDPDEMESRLVLEDWKRVSCARCARVSYLTHEGKRDPQKDLALWDRLVQGSGFGHWSPMEHVAQALAMPERSGPFVGWKQFRKDFPKENVEG